MYTISKVSQLPLDWEFRQQNAFVIKLVESRLDNLLGTELLNQIEAWIAANVMMQDKVVPVLIIDMSNISFVNSQGLEKLVTALKIMKANNSNLCIYGQQPAVKLVFEISGLDKLFAIFEDHRAMSSVAS